MQPRLPMFAFVAAALLLSGSPARAAEALETQKAFFENLKKMCGQRLEGATRFPQNADHPMVGKKLVLTVGPCGENEVRVPFLVGEDKSRTWILTLSDRGLLFKHDHRHPDGSPDEVTNYGGWAAPDGTPHRQRFPADPETAKLIPEAATNVWTLEIDPEKRQLIYFLERHGEPRYRAVFDFEATGLKAAAAPRQSTPFRGTDWPQWRGPGRDGIAYDFKAPKIWPQMLSKVWSVKAGDGLASPVVVGDRVYLHSRQGDDEVVSAFALASGNLLWSDSYRSPFTVEPQMGSYGPYATPVVDSGIIYAFGMNEVLSAYDTASGKLLWRKDWGTEYKVPHPDFGTAAAPLVADGLSIVHVGGRGKGALVALDAKTGEPRWKMEGEGPSYAATMVATFEGVRQVIAQSESTLFGVELATGKRLWELPWRSPSGNTILTPVIDGPRFILSTQDADVQSIRPFKKDGAWMTETVWSSRDGKMFMSSPVLSDGRLYGFSTRQKGTVYSLDPATGKLLWSSPGAMGENGMMVAAGEYLFILLDTADLYVARTGGDAWTPVARFNVADSPTYTYPVILGDRILVRDRYGLTLWSLEGWGFSFHGAGRRVGPDDAHDAAQGEQAPEDLDGRQPVPQEAGTQAHA